MESFLAGKELIWNSHLSRRLRRREISGHKGCVNCLKWSESGRLLASGSDDLRVLLWEPALRGSAPTAAIRTGHGNNIFSVEWVPGSGDRELLSAAGDGCVRLLDANRSSGPVTVFSCHRNRIKRLAVSPTEPWVFWSAAEDGYVMEFDLRADGGACQSSCTHCLVDLGSLVGDEAEAKCLALCPSRPELLAVGANDPFVRLFDRRMLSRRRVDNRPALSSPRSFLLGVTVPPPRAPHASQLSLPPEAYRLFCPGHLQLPRKGSYRSLVTTFLSFHPSGSELLVNLGGEQIYIFPVNGGTSLLTELPSFLKKCVTYAQAGTNGHSRNGKNNGYAYGPKVTHSSKELDLVAEGLKELGNSYFSKKNYGQAIECYSGALLRCPENPVIHANRAAALLKRGWDGDVYAALRDAHRSLCLDPSHTKALYRLVKCLGQLEQGEAAHEALALFRARFPREAASDSFRDLASAVAALDPSGPPRERSADVPPDAPPDAGPSADELRARATAGDFSHRFVGHCNTTTDIKEASYLGGNGEFVVAGSDDGTFFVWERASGRIVSVLRGDGSIVNCLQPAPGELVLATSGIDWTVKLWRPAGEETAEERCRRWRVADVEAAARANQRRMNADPFEAMLLQFVANANPPNSSHPNETEEDESPTASAASVHCTQS